MAVEIAPTGQRIVRSALPSDGLPPVHANGRKRDYRPAISHLDASVCLPSASPIPLEPEVVRRDGSQDSAERQKAPHQAAGPCGSVLEVLLVTSNIMTKASSALVRVHIRAKLRP